MWSVESDVENKIVLFLQTSIWENVDTAVNGHMLGHVRSRMTT